jgi:hypothetical protein
MGKELIIIKYFNNEKNAHLYEIDGRNNKNNRVICEQ